MDIVSDLFLDVDPNWNSSGGTSNLSTSIPQITIYGINQLPSETDASLPSGPCPFLNSESPRTPSKSGTESDTRRNGEGKTQFRKVEEDEEQNSSGYNHLLNEALELADRVEQSMPMQESSSYSGEISEEFQFATIEQPDTMELESKHFQAMTDMPERTAWEKKESQKECIPVSPIISTNVIQPTIANVFSSSPPEYPSPFYVRNMSEKERLHKVMEVPMSPCTPDTIGGHPAPSLTATGGSKRNPVLPEELPELSLTETFQSRQDRLNTLNENTPSSTTTPVTSQVHIHVENPKSGHGLSSSAAGSTLQPATSSRDYGSHLRIESVFGQKLSKSVSDTYREECDSFVTFRFGASTVQEERNECNLPSSTIAQDPSPHESEPLQNAECADRFLSALLSNPNVSLEAANVPPPSTLALSSTMDYSQGKTNPVRTEKAASSSTRSHRPPKKRMSKREAARIALQKERKRDATLRQMVKDKTITDDELLQLKPKKKRRAAKFEKPRASRFCHVCSRTPKSVRLVTCANIQTGTCRKVVCIKCFETYNLGDFEAVEKGTQEWPCTHCTNQCPERAQCKTYQRTNDKLRLKRLKQEKQLVVRKRKTAQVDKEESVKRAKFSPNANGVSEKQC